MINIAVDASRVEFLIRIHKLQVTEKNDLVAIETTEKIVSVTILF